MVQKSAHLIISGDYRRAASHFHSRMQSFAYFWHFLSDAPSHIPPNSQDGFGMLHITSSQSNPKKARSKRQTNPRKQSWGGEKTCSKAKNYSRLGFFPSHFEVMLRNKPQQVKISPEKTQGSLEWMQHCLLLFLKGLIKWVENLKYFHLGVKSN